MSSPPELTDRATLARHRARARRAPEMFLHAAVRDEIKERLTEVNRTFTSPAIVTGFPDFWSEAFPAARIVPDEDVLDLDPGGHDLVIHALALHWANDPVGQLVQMRRALAPDGFCITALFGGRTLAELRSVLAETETRLMGGLSPRVAPMGEIRDLGALLQRAGLALPVADSMPLTVTYKSVMRLVRDLRAMGETNALAQRDRQPLNRQFLAQVDSTYAEHFEADGGRIGATFEIVFLSGWAPAESQQKPLRPGSAAARLADALGTDEKGAGDPIIPPRD